MTWKDQWLGRVVRVESGGSLAKSPWLVALVLWVLNVPGPDIMFRGDVLAPRYLVAVAVSLVTWAIALILVARVRSRSQRLAIIVAGLFAAIVTLSVGGAHGYHRFFRKDMRSIEWEFALENPVFSQTLVTTVMTRTDRIILISDFVLLLAGALWLATRPQILAPRLRLWRALPLLLPIAAVILFVRPLSGDLVLPRAVGVGTYAHVRHGAHPQTLPVPARVPPPSGRPRHADNVILIINESLGAREALREGGYTQKTAAFLKAHADHAVSFPHAETVATATCVSIPTILTGLHSEAPREEFASAPLMWHDARALGYATGLFSAQEFEFEFFEQYFLENDAPDMVRTAGDYTRHAAERVNELGVDEAQVVDDALRFVEQTPAERPFFMVVQFNSTHWPCWAPSISAIRWSTSLAVGNDPVRCAAATRYVDEQTARLLDALAQHDRLEKTMILLTSDHGEVFRPGRPLRRYSFYEDVLAIPFIVHLPAALADQVGTLRENAKGRVSNLDLYPTLLDWWGRWPLSDARRPALTGQSLLRPIPMDRVLVSITDSSISRETRAFALFHRQWKWMVTEQTGLELFDLDADPDELVDRAERAPPEELRLFHAEISKYPRAREILADKGARGATTMP